MKKNRVLELIILTCLTIIIILLLTFVIFKIIDSKPLPKGQKVASIGEIYV